MEKPKPHIILIAYYFPPGQEIGGFRPFRFYKYLKRLGYPCHVITASAQSSKAAGDIIFVPDKLRGVWEGKTKSQLSIQGYLELLVRKAMFPGQVGIIWSLAVARECREIIRRHPGERFVVFTTYPPIGVFIAGLIAQRNPVVRWIADFRDPLAGLIFKDMSQQARFWSRVLEKSIFRRASAVLANAEGAAVQWRERYPWASRKLHVLCNGFDPEEIPEPRNLPDRQQKVILHAGTLYEGRNPNLIIAAIGRLRSKGAPEALGASILLLGGIDHKAGLEAALYDNAQREGWLELQARVPKAESQRLMEEADGLLLVQPQTDVQVPGKLFEYICVGRPILALVPRDSAVEQILDKSGIPHVCIYADDEAGTVDRKLLDFLRLPNSPCAYSSWFGDNFNARSQAEQLGAIIDDIADSSPST